MPISFIHGTADDVVNIDHGKRLFEHAKQKARNFILVPDGGHNNLIQFPEYLDGINMLLP